MQKLFLSNDWSHEVTCIKRLRQRRPELAVVCDFATGMTMAKLPSLSYVSVSLPTIPITKSAYFVICMLDLHLYQSLCRSLSGLYISISSRRRPFFCYTPSSLKPIMITLMSTQGYAAILLWWEYTPLVRCCL